MSDDLAPPADDRGTRREITVDALAIGIATGAYAISFGALAVANGFTAVQTQALSLLMFTGASQFAAVAVIGAGGGAAAALLTAWMLGSRNGLYALALDPLLRPRRWRRLLAAQLTIDESTAMAVAHEDDPRAWPSGFGFWVTGAMVFLLWNLGTLIGALGAGAVGDPRDWGLDAAAAAALLALLWPRLSHPEARAVAATSGIVALLLTPLVAPGLPVLACAGIAIVVGLWPRGEPQ